MSQNAGQKPIPEGTLKHIVISEGKLKSLNPFVLILEDVYLKPL